MMKRFTLLITMLVMAVLNIAAQTNLLREDAESPILPTMLQRSTYTYSEEERKNIVDGASKVETSNENSTDNLVLLHDNAVDGFYFDLGEGGKQLGSVKITWTGCHSNNYGIYISDEVPTLENPGTKVNSYADVTPFTKEGMTYTGVYGKTARYVAFVPATSGWDYGVIMSEFEVLSYVAPKITTLKTSTPFLPAATPTAITLTAYDQIGAEFTGNITYKDEDDNIVTPYSIVLKHGINTIKAVDDAENVATTTVYAYNDEDAPGIPTDTYLPLYITLSTNTNTVWDWAEQPTTQLNEIKILNQPAMLFRTFKKIAIGNKIAPFNQSDAAVRFNPEDNKCAEVVINVFSPTSTTAAAYIELEGYGTNTPVALSAGWNTLTYALGTYDGENNFTYSQQEAGKAKTIVAVKLGINADDAGNYPDVLVANAYFKKIKASTIPPTWSEGFPKLDEESVTPTSATIKVKATDDLSTNLLYVVTCDDDASFFAYIKGSNDVESNFKVTGLTPGTNRTYKITVYDEGGLGSEAKSIAINTGYIDVSSINVVPEVQTILQGELSDPLTITVKDQKGNVHDDGFSLNYTINTEKQDETFTTGTITFQSDTKGVFRALSSVSGIKKTVVTVTATSGSYSASKDITIYVQPSKQITVKYKVNDGTEQTKTVAMGQLSTIESETDLLNITSLEIVTGYLSNADVRTIRKMAGGTDYVPYPTDGATRYGKLETLKLAGAKFPYELGDYYYAIRKDTTNNVVEETKVGNSVFSNYFSSCILADCIHLKHVTIPTYITKIDNSAFDYCINLEDINFNGNIVEIGTTAFRNNKKLKVLPLDQLTNLRIIGDYAFAYCNGDDNFTYTGNFTDTKIEDIGAYAFYKDRNFGADNSPQVLKFPETLTQIQGFAFTECTGIGTVDFTLAQNLETIGYAAFESSKIKLANIQLPNSITTLDNLAFSQTAVERVNIPKNNSLKRISTLLFNRCEKLEYVYIPSNIEAIGDNAFIGCTSLGEGSVSFEDYGALKKIEAYAFNGCSSLKNVFNNDGLINVEEIGEAAFMGCANLQSDEARHLMSNLTQVNTSVFQGCTSLEFLTIGPKITSIGKSAFREDVNVTRVDVSAATAPDCYRYYWEYADKYDNDGNLVYENDGVTPEKEWQYVDRNPFAGMYPNHVTVNFTSDAASNYTSYRRTMQTGTEEVNGDAKKDNAFMFLLTKTMRETGNTAIEGNSKIVDEVDVLKGKYDVHAQDHADVIIERTFQKNWNTIMLPFAMDATHLEQTFELTANKAVVAKYGWTKEGEETFVNSASNREQGVLQFETVSQLDANTPYLFMIVDEKGGHNEDIPLQKGGSSTDFPMAATSQTWKAVDVNVINALEAGFTLGNKAGGGYTFVGTYDDQPNIVSSEHNILYINTSGVFKYKLKDAGTTTRLKGFRSYFTFDDPALAKTFSVFVDEDHLVTEIDGVELNKAVLRGDIYSINGQLIRKNGTTEGLMRGVYIVNGKKYVVK